MNASLLRALHENCLEPLESRIAPATIFIGNPNVNDTEYADAPFVNTETSADTIATQVGGGEIGVNDTFLLKLAQDDRVVLFATGGNTDFITVEKGSAVAFFVDHNLDGEVQATELTGLALGKGSSIEIKGTVYGDVVTNLKSDGTLDLTGPGGTGGLVASDQDLAKLAVSDVQGGVFVGGAINSINGATFGKITTGDAADGETFDFFRDNNNDPAIPDAVPGGNGTLAVVAVDAGPSIKDIVIKAVGDRIEAGGGGAGENGGSITNVEVTSDSTGLLVAAGNGGSGGNGGKISKVYISGFDDADPNSVGGIRITAGSGGDALAGSSGKGGIGGDLSQVFVGFDRNGSQIDPSTNLSQDKLLISAGAGGDGGVAGRGGNVKSVQARVSVQGEPGDDVAVIAGAGGDAFTGGKAGVGGTISKVDIRNQNPIVSGSIVALRAGNGGTAASGGDGAAGGSITNAVLLGEGLLVNAGNGSSGTVGGKGGKIKGVNTVVSETVFSRDVTLNSGWGGNGGSGNGGAGGAMSKVLISTGDFTNFVINGGTSEPGAEPPRKSADGGTSTGGKGGVGGAVSNVTVLEIPVDTITEGTVTIRGGVGGGGAKTGGAGGALTKMVVSGFDLAIQASAGNGGAATGGNGAKGGDLKALQLSSVGVAAGLPAPGTFTAGTGGLGSSAGGAGGNISKSAFSVDGDVVVAAGNGGSGGGGASGRGGGVKKTGAFSTFGAGTLKGGDAGVDGGDQGTGGSITEGSVLRASTGITILGGNGAHGGAGGSLSTVSFSSSAASLLPAPSGDILVKAGNGSAQGSDAGVGGSLKSIVGYISSGDTGTTTYAAGTGGGGGGSAAGGSIKNLDILGGGAPGSIATVSAGDAGDGTSSANGANGGSIKAVSIAGVEIGTIIRSIAAGDGGNGTSKGGTGGSIQQVFALGADIGDRSGVGYGYTSMGGIFAGVGGTGAVKGLNGSVSDVRAEAIAAIVAGRGTAPDFAAAPDFAEKVSGVIVGTSNAPVNLLKVEEGDFAPDGGDPNFGTVDGEAYAVDNLVGFYKDPLRTDTNKFQFTDLDADTVYDAGETPADGLIMARVIDLKTFNFTPEAYLTPTSFFDYNNRLS